MYTGAQTNEQIGLEQGNRWGLIEPAPSANRNDVTLAHVQHSTQDVDPHRVTNSAGACGGILQHCKMSSSNFGM
jgi:hypothetical protein